MSRVSRLSLAPAAGTLALLMSACGGGGSGTDSNRAPVAVADAVTVAWNAASAPIDVMANDSDPDNDAFTLHATTQPAHGSVSMGTDGKITYTPTLSYIGPDQFTYTIRDRFGATATATVSVTVQGKLTLTGRVVGLAQSVVTAQVGEQTYTATADATGKYQLPIAASAGNQFITLTTQGSGAQATIKLRSLVGEASSLAVRATNMNGGAIDNGFDSLFQLGALSTARAALAAAANGGADPTTQAALDLAHMRISANALLQRAATIRQVMNATVTLPTGVADTSALVSNAEAYSALVSGQLAVDAAALDADIQALQIDASQTVPFPTTVEAATTLRSFGDAMDSGGARMATLNPDKSASFSIGGPLQSGTWAVSDGVLTLTPTKAFPSWVHTTADGDLTAQVNAVEVRRHVGNPLRSQVSWRYKISYVNGAGKPVSDVTGWIAETMLDASLVTVPTAAELTAQPYGGVAVPDAGTTGGWAPDTVVFAADGTGHATRTATNFTWTRDDTALVLNFSGGITLRIVRVLADANGVQETWMAHQTAGTQPQTYQFSFAVVKSNPAAAFTATGAVNTWMYGYASHYVHPAPWGVTVRADGTATAGLSYVPSAGYAASWQLNADGAIEMVSYRRSNGQIVGQCPAGETCALYRQRTWTKLAQVGDRIYVATAITFKTAGVVNTSYMMRALDAKAPVAP